MIETIEFNGEQYPAFQATGFAARFAFPFAKEVCKGYGYDIGCNRFEWCLGGAIPVDPTFRGSSVVRRLLEGLDLPDDEVDYIFSSHCLEHLPCWVSAIEHWASRIKSGGTLFLYLPHPDQQYWKPWNNRKHIHSLYPEMIEQYLKECGHFTKVFVSGRDLNHSFYAIAEKV